MSNTKKPDVISPIRPRRQMPDLPAEADQWIRAGTPPNTETTPTDTPQPTKTPNPTPSTTNNPEPDENQHNQTQTTTTQQQPDKKPKVFTLDIPIDLHKAMRRKTILNGTNMTADTQRVLNEAYNTNTPPAANIPDYPRLEPDQTQRITIAMSTELHTKIKLNTLDSGSTMANEIRYHLEREYGPSSQ